MEVYSWEHPRTSSMFFGFVGGLSSKSFRVGSDFFRKNPTVPPGTETERGCSSGFFMGFSMGITWYYSYGQWPFQDPIDGGTDSIYKAYFLGLCKGISPQNMAL